MMMMATVPDGLIGGFFSSKASRTCISFLHVPFAVTKCSGTIVKAFASSALTYICFPKPVLFPVSVPINGNFGSSVKVDDKAFVFHTVPAPGDVCIRESIPSNFISKPATI